MSEPGTDQDRQDQQQDQWDTTVDVLVVGSGAGGMSAAISAARRDASVLVVEKADCFGGNTALSGGGIWIPDNPVLHRAGIHNGVENTITYLEAITAGSSDPARIRAYAEQGPRVIAGLEEASEHLRFQYVRGYSDYHPEEPGGRPEGQSIEPLPVDRHLLGELAGDLRRSDLPMPDGMWITTREFRDLSLAARSLPGKLVAAKVAWRMASNAWRRRAMATLGTALATRLRLALRDLGVPLWLKSPLNQLVTDSSGRVVGAVVERNGRRLRVRAVRGVILASGGFESNQELRQRYLPQLVVDNNTAGAASNTGDGLVLGEQVGARTALLDDAWWMPAVRLPNGSVFCLVSERCIPRHFIVDQHGKRFVNESAPYVNFVHAQIEGDHSPMWYITDATAFNRYQFAGNPPGKGVPKAWLDSGLAVQADSIEELARRIGVDPTALSETARAFNEYARTGRDQEFGRGESAYDRYYGDETLPNPVLDTVDHGPFVAISIVAGDLGTKGGLLTDAHARVLDRGGRPIAGLYAAGNVSAAVMGHDYAGPGATIGPALVFGWLAAEDACAGPEEPRS